MEVIVILEVAILDVKPGQQAEFESAFDAAQKIIASMPGYGAHQLQSCLENPNRYLLLVEWQTLEAHTVGFRGSAAYQRWKDLLHHFYDPFPVVEHYRAVFKADAGSGARLLQDAGVDEA
jgi:heme-degrading monooxygenase HmoA